MSILDQVRSAGVTLKSPIGVQVYLDMHPDIVPVLFQAIDLSKKKIPSGSEIIVDFWSSMEDDGDCYVQVLLRLPCYENEAYDFVHEVSNEICMLIPPNDGYLLVTTDFADPFCD